MPQLDPTYFGPQLFWLFVFFFVLLIGMRYLILPRLDKILKAREKLLDQKLLQIQDLETNAEQISIEAKLQLKEAQEESKKLIAQIKADLNQEIIKAKRQLSEKSTQQLQETNEDLKKEIDKLIESVQEQKPAMAAMVLEKMLGHKVSEEKCKKILEEKTHGSKLG